MAQGLPSGFVTLYDEQSNPILVRQDVSGNYTLAVTDKNAEKMLEALAEQTQLLEEILLRLQ